MFKWGSAACEHLKQNAAALALGPKVLLVHLNTFISMELKLLVRT